MTAQIQSGSKRLEFQPLHRSAHISVSDYQCRAHRGGPGAEEYSDTHDIVLMRSGTFTKHHGRRSATADLNQVVFFSKGTSYRVSHPGDCGDRGTVFSLSPGLLHDMIRSFDPSIDDHPERPFPFLTAAATPRTFWRHYEIIQRLGNEDHPPEPLWMDEAVLRLMTDILAGAFGQRESKILPRRSGTEADYALRCEAAKTYLARRMGERITLDDVAGAAHMSPFHFARIFRQQNGMPVHRYLVRLRLRAAFESVAAGAKDLTALALELGFSSHSHLSDSFRREFKRSPSDIRTGRCKPDLP